MSYSKEHAAPAAQDCELTILVYERRQAKPEAAIVRLRQANDTSDVRAHPP